MISLSIEDAFQWVQRFALREWRLLLPVAFAFIALPPLAMDLLVPAMWWTTMQAAAQTGNPALAGSVLSILFPLMLLVFLIGAVGALAIVALAVRPGISVGEAIMLALRRLPTLIGSLVLVAIGEVVVAIVVGIVVAFGHVTAAGMQALLIGVMLGLGLVVGVRLVTLVPMVAARPIGPVSALRESWIMTNGAFWRIFGAVVIYLIGAIVVVLAASSALGAILLLIGRGIGAPELGVALGLVLERALTAVVGLGFHLLAVAIFRQLDRSYSGI